MAVTNYVESERVKVSLNLGKILNLFSKLKNFQRKNNYEFEKLEDCVSYFSN